MGKEELESAVAVNFLYEVLLKKPELQLKPKHSRDRTHILLFFVGPKAKELYVIRNIKSTRILIEHPLTVALSGVHPDQNASPYQGGTVKKAAVGRRISINRQHTVYVDSTEALSKLIVWYAKSDGSGNTLGSDGDESTEPSGLSSISLAELQQADVLALNRNSTPSPPSSSVLNEPNSFTREEKNGTESEAENIGVLLDGFDGEEQDVLAKRRVNQGKFRKCLLRYWSSRCCIINVTDTRLLVASHIVPWSKASKQERGDPANGLLLSVVWDALFDRGLISFRDDGSAILDKLDRDLLVALGIDETEASISSDKLTDKHKEFLKRHRLLFAFE